MTGLVRLEPPYRRSAGGWNTGLIPLTAAPPLIRTRAMGRWHRVRSGVHYTPASRAWTAHTSFATWCGQGVSDVESLRAVELPVGEPLCGTCEGRAVGAGHPATGQPIPGLIHQPVTRRPPPPVCPATRRKLWDAPGWPDGVFPCPACRVPTRLRGCGGWHDSGVKIEGHPPGPDLCEPCAFHRWDGLQLLLVESGPQAVCSCRLPVSGAAS
ncbi:hypothetical protein [Microcystis phage Mwe-JY05]